MNFTTVAMDMIINHAAKRRFMSGGQTNVPLTIRTMTGAGFGSGGQHCDYLEAWFAHPAGMKVVTASSQADAYGLLRTIAPYDKETVLNSVAKTRRAVIVHEAVMPFGVGAEIAAHLQEELVGSLLAPIKRVGAHFSPVPFSKPLETMFLPSQSAITESIRVTMK